MNKVENHERVVTERLVEIRAALAEPRASDRAAARKSVAIMLGRIHGSIQDFTTLLIGAAIEVASDKEIVASFVADPGVTEMLHGDPAMMCRQALEIAQIAERHRAALLAELDPVIARHLAEATSAGIDLSGARSNSLPPALAALLGL